MKKNISEFFNASSIKGKFIKGFPFLVYIALILFIFSDFFFKGYVLDGNWDRRLLIVPFDIIALRAFQNFHIAQWNPFIFCGTSYFINAVNVTFYPLSWIVYSFPEKFYSTLITASSAVHFGMAGYFSYLFFKQISKNRFWGLCGSLVYILSSTSTLNLTSGPNFISFVYFPLLLYFIHRAREKSLLSNILSQTLAFALLLLGGMIQINLYILGFCLLYSLNISILNEDGKIKFDIKPLLVTSISIIFSVLISAIKYVPFYFAIKSNKEIISFDAFLHFASTPANSLLRFFMPEFFGNSLKLPYLSGNNQFETFTCYVGILASFLGLYCFFFLWSKRTLFWKIIIALSILTLLGTPFSYFHYILTGKALVLFNRVAWLLPICFCRLFVADIEKIISSKKQIKGFIAFSLALFAGIMLWANANISIFAGNNPHLWNMPGRDVSSFTVLELNLFKQYMLKIAVPLMKTSILHFDFIFLLMITIFAFLLRSKRENKIIIFKTAFLLVLLIDLVSIANIDLNSCNKFLVPQPFFTSSALDKQAVEFFHKNEMKYRILAFSEGLRFDTVINFNIYNSSGYDNISPPRVARIYSYPQKLDRIFSRQVKPHLNRTISLSSTKILLSETNIFYNQLSLPRYSLFSQYIVSTNEDQVLKTLFDNKFDINKVVILDKKPKLSINKAINQGEVIVLKENNEDILFKVSTDQNSILLLNDTYDEGWSVFIDGKKSEIIRANYAFRAVEIPKGEHNVFFSFRQQGLDAGRNITLSALMIFIILLGIQLKKKFNNTMEI